MPEKGLCLVTEWQGDRCLCGPGARAGDVVGYAARIGLVECEDHGRDFGFYISITGSFAWLTEEKQKTLTLGLKR